ncbi:class F sortase [Actinomycetes bacterium KLBMP 9759]
MRRLLLLSTLVVLALVGGACATAPPAPEAERVVSAVPPIAALDPSAPAALDVPSIGVHASVMRLGLNPDGTVEVPPLDSPDAGWYEESPAPGELGPAVLLGHVDSARWGPGVFHRLSELRPGDAVTVTRADGGVVGFRVDRVETRPKAEFPTAEVYGDIDHAGLRLITCGGSFDQVRRSYEDNVIVYASAVSGAHDA